MGSVTVGPNRLGAAVSGILDGYSDAVVEAVDAESAASVQRLVRATRATAPVGSTRRVHFRSYISSRVLRRSPMGDTYVWYVRAPEYRLAHLLERDHATGGRANRGRARGTHFIQTALEAEERAYVANVRRAVGRVA